MSAKRGLLIALGGLPGVGKSTLATALSRRIGAVHLRIDTIEQAIRNCGAIVSGPEGYRVAADVALDNLRLGRVVVVDSVNPLSVTRNLWRTVASHTGARLAEVELVCSDLVEHRHRVERRKADIAGLALPTWQQVLDREFEPWTTAEVVDTAGGSVEATLARLLAKVPSGHRLRTRVQ